MKKLFFDFNKWLESDNVSEIGDSYVTQCTQWQRRFSLTELRLYWLEEYGVEMYEGALVLEAKIIFSVQNMCAKAFMDYPDFDANEPMELIDAVALLVSEHLESEDSAKVYDLLLMKFKKSR